MKKLDDRICFYLEHEQQILEWARLGTEASREADLFFRSLAYSLKTLENDSRIAWASLDEGYPKLFLIRTKWKDQAVRPRVAIGLEWQKSIITFRNSYVGLWVDIEADGGTDFSSKLRTWFKTKQPIAAKYANGNAWWPAYRYVIPSREDIGMTSMNSTQRSAKLLLKLGAS